jgi:transposase-like protein
MVMKGKTGSCPKCKSIMRVTHAIVNRLQRYKCKGCGCKLYKESKTWILFAREEESDKILFRRDRI